MFWLWMVGGSRMVMQGEDRSSCWLMFLDGSRSLAFRCAEWENWVWIAGLVFWRREYMVDL